MIEQIVEWLKEHGNVLDCKDEPYMRFVAEYQDWSFMAEGQGRLVFGYFFDRDDETFTDLMFVLDVNNDAVLSATCTNSVVDCQPAHPVQVIEFLELVWERHFLIRWLEYRDGNGGSQNRDTPEGNGGQDHAGSDGIES